MRPYLPDGTQIATYEELQAERKAAKARAEFAEERLVEARIEIAEVRAEAAEALVETLVETNARRIAELEAEMTRLQQNRS